MTRLAIEWPVELNEHGGRMLWAAAWLAGNEGGEGEALYSGRGGEAAQYPVPATATGVRIRRWPNEGLDPEYVDIVGLDRVDTVFPSDLDFDVRQPFSRLQE